MLTLGMVLGDLAALGSSSWVSWMAALVPSLGRYFGFPSAGSLTTLLSVPLLSLQCLFGRVEQCRVTVWCCFWGRSRAGESGISVWWI